MFQLGALPIGLDLGASGAKVLQLARTGARLRIQAAARIEAESEIAEDETRFAALATVLERKIRSGDFKGRKCVVGLDDRLLRVRSIRLPTMTDTETEQSLCVDAASRLGFDRNESVETGWTRAGLIQQGDEQREEIILTGIRTQDAERIAEMTLAAGLEPIALEPNFCAVARCFARRRRRAVDQEVAQIVVDLGRRTTNVLAMRGETLCFYKQIDWGSERLDRAAAERLDMDQSIVAQIRRQRLGQAFSDPGRTEKVDERVDRAVFDAVRPLLNELAHEITLCVRYFLVTFRGAKPESIVLAGGDATEPRLAEIIAELSGLPTELGRPLEGVDLGPTSLPMNRRGPLSEWATAAGLTLRAEQGSGRDLFDSARNLLAPLARLRKAS
jgi:type IV pilus assembly protein PilM